AVVRGSAENHGGRAQSLTAPSADAQADAMARAMRSAGFDPSTLTYVEAHGTGTRLGDPVEVAGLKKAFDALYREWKLTPPARPHCRVGSIKTTLGHLEPASGLAGIAQVILAMRHGTLPQNRHLRSANRQIDLAGTPLELVTATAPWERLTDASGRPLPRRAGVNSFGFGGANCHVVLEEYIDDRGAERAGPPTPQVLPVSARSPELLREHAAQLAARLTASARSGERGTLAVADVAHTLQVGRVAFEERLAVVARDVREAAAELRAFAEGAGAGPNRLVRSDGGPAVTGASDPRSIAAAWAAGGEVDWQALREGVPARRASLPTRRFEGKRHWLGPPAPADGATPAGSVRPDAAGPGLSAERAPSEHALVARRGATFEIALAADSHWLADHRVRGRPVLAGAAILEAARAAGELAGGGRAVREISQVVWMRPIACEGDSIEAEIRMEARPDGRSFAVQTRRADGAAVVHAQGVLSYEAPAAARSIDVAAIRARCNVPWSAATCYERFARLGLEYGPTFRPIVTAWTRDGEALARLGLPAHLTSTRSGLTLHPTLLDGALQSVIRSLWDAEGGPRLWLPFSIAAVRIHAPLAPIGYAHALRKGVAGGTMSFDVCLAAEDGTVAVEIAGCALREPPAPTAKATAVAVRRDEGLLRVVPRWAPAVAPDGGSSAPRALLVVGASDEVARALRASAELGASAVVCVREGTAFAERESGALALDTTDPAQCRALVDVLKSRGKLPSAVLHLAQPAATDEGEPQCRSARSLLALAQALLTCRPPGGLSLLHLFTSDGPPARVAQEQAVAALLAPLAVEESRVRCRSVELADAPPADRIARLAARELCSLDRAEREVLYRDERRFVKRLTAASAATGSGGSRLRQGGVHLITGGLGGLGQIFAEHLARTLRAKLVLVGRSALRDADAAGIAALERLGAEVLHVRADVGDRRSVEEAVARARDRFGRIDGVLHAAGVLRDGFLRNKAREDFDAVVAPKVLGAVHLDEALGDSPLELFALF
ncbi:MAG TPA: SDR family NAD(P)-dependent oxidoreductase, partial [Anaeromyxobacter sp.]|nr:SDR family NAD(P)-dependent oxidoreductase [Anaeromyxobacter sp.]